MAGGAALFLLTNGIGTKSYEKFVEVVVVNDAIQPISLVAADASKPGVLKWKFGNTSTPGYIFPDKSASAPGIVFKIASAPAGSGCTRVLGPTDSDFAIHNCDAQPPNSAQFHCNVKKGDAGDCYAYTVNVVPGPSSSASAVAPLDPWFKQQ